MDKTKLYLCFEATNKESAPVYLIYSAKVSDLMVIAPKSAPKFTYEDSIKGVSSMGCGLFKSKIVLAGGLSGAGEETVYNRGLITYDPVSKKVFKEEIPKMRGRKVRPLVFELYERLYVLDTSSSVYKRTWEIYYPSLMFWEQLSDPFCNMYSVRRRDKLISGRTPYSWFVCGNTLSISLPRLSLTYIHHAREVFKGFTVDDNQPLPFHGMATTYWQSGCSYVLVISFSKGSVQGQGSVEGRELKYSPAYFGGPKLFFKTDPYEQPGGEMSSYFAECGNGIFCLMTFDNVNIHVYVFKIRRNDGKDGATSWVLESRYQHKYTFNDFSVEGSNSVSIPGCFALPRDEESKRIEESKVYNYIFWGSELGEKDDDLPPTTETDGVVKVEPDYDSNGADSDIDLFNV